MKELTPFDYETARMVENLTEKPCELHPIGEYIYFKADYSKHPEPEYVNAVYEAIAGRIGKRLVGIIDNADKKILEVRMKFSQNSLPQLYRFPDSEPLKQAGDKFSKEIVWALKVYGTVECAERLARFCGGGEMEIPTEGNARFLFVDKVSGVWKTANETDYILYIPGKPYRILTEKEFESEYQIK